MAGYRAACLRLDDLPKSAVLLHAFLTASTALASQGYGLRKSLLHQIRPPVQSLLYIGEQAFFKRSAVFFAHFHLSVYYLNARLEIQQIGAQRRQSGTAPPFPQILQAVDLKARLYPARQLLQPMDDILCGQPHICQPHRLHYHLPAAGGQVARIHRINVGKLPRRQAGILMAAGKFRADIDVDHRVVLG